MTFPTKEEVNFALRFETFDLPPYGKESSCNSKNILKGNASTKTGYRCQMFAPYITRLT